MTAWNRKDLVGRVFGRLVVKAYAETIGHRAFWLAECSCGGTARVATTSLVGGNTKSCGCLKREVLGASQRTHGCAGKSKAYSVWKGMKKRCVNANERSFKNYGARGITVCERWQSFDNFLADMGEPAPGLSIERINNNAGYSPSNCIWADDVTQARNRRPLPFGRISELGLSVRLDELARLVGINKQTIASRLYRGESLERVLRPVQVRIKSVG